MEKWKNEILKGFEESVYIGQVLGAINPCYMSYLNIYLSISLYGPFLWKRAIWIPDCTFGCNTETDKKKERKNNVCWKMPVDLLLGYFYSTRVQLHERKLYIRISLVTEIQLNLNSAYICTFFEMLQFFFRNFSMSLPLEIRVPLFIADSHWKINQFNQKNRKIRPIVHLAAPNLKGTLVWYDPCFIIWLT